MTFLRGVTRGRRASLLIKRVDPVREIGRGASRLALAMCVVAWGCSWERFENLRENLPVEELVAPEGLERGFGQAVTAVRSAEVSMVLVSGEAQGIAGTLFTLGVRKEPTLDPLEKTYCQPGGQRPCSIARRPAALARAWSPAGERSLCFVSGWGQARNGPGLWTRCTDRSEYAYPVPPDVEDLAISATQGSAVDLSLVGDRSEAPILVAAAPGRSRAWYYAPVTAEPIDLTVPGDPPEGFGASLAVLRGPESPLIAVGSPTLGRVWMFRIDGVNPIALGCLPNVVGWGRTLAAGDVDADGFDDLAVAGNGEVTVFSGAAWAAAPQTNDVACRADVEPAGVPLTSLRCAENDDTAGCAKSDFGAALTVADLDGDKKAELVVGAPKMNVRGAEKAGAVLVYDGSGALIDTRILSNAKAETFMGASIAAVAQGGENEKQHDILIVGAPGQQKAVILFCAGGEGSAEGVRCE